MRTSSRAILRWWQISNKIKEVDKQLAAEVNTIKNSLKAAYESSLSQENEMKARIETLREEVLNLQKKGHTI